MKKIFTFFSFVLLFLFSGKSQIIINEILVSNASVNYDPDFKNFESWIELYNSGSTPFTLNACFLTDNKTKPDKWLIPSTTIAPGGFLLIWADKENIGRHTNFSLNSSGEFIGLYNAFKMPIDTFSFGKQYPNISYGRISDGSTTLKFFGKPTPGKSNTTESATVFAGKPQFSIKGGFYTGAQSLVLSTASPTANIYYTLDGSEPADTSALYNAPINIPANRTVRAIVYDNGFIPSPIITQTYFINETATVPVVSVTVPPRFLWNDTIGIYIKGSGTIANYNQSWDRAANVEFFKPYDTAQFNTYCGIEISGSASRSLPQKSLDVKIRDKYGVNKIRYFLFPGRKYDNIHGFVIRNSGNDWSESDASAAIMCRDGLIQTVVQGQMDVDYMAYQPAIVFLNGKYWGITDLREKQDKYYCNNNFPQIDNDSLDIIKQFWKNEQYVVQEGDSVLMQKFFNDFVKKNSMAIKENYKKASDSIDIREFINYIIVESYSNNIDWPVNNIKLWRQQGVTKWRWMIYDTDMGFGGFFPYTTTFYPNRKDKIMDAYNADTDMKPANNYMGKWTSIVLGSLMKSTAFKNEFAQTYAAHLNTTYLNPRVNKIVDSIKNIIRPEIPRHVTRWGTQGSIQSLAHFDNHIQVTRNFLNERYPLVWTQLKNITGLSLMAPVKISRTYAKMGKVYVQGATVYDSVMSGPYFNNVPIELRAEPDSGCIFNWWEIKKSGKTTYSKNKLLLDTLKSTSSGDTTFYKAVFTKVPINKYILAIKGGTGSGLYNLGEVVNIQAVPEIKDKEFVHWSGDINGVANVNNASTMITISSDAVVQSVYTHLLTVNNGTGTGTYAPGTAITIKANQPPSGNTFSKWMGYTSTLANLNDSVTTLVMPASEISVTATYKVGSEMNDASSFFASVFPNPVTDILHLEIDEEMVFSFFIYDITGKLVMEKNGYSKDISINVSGLSNGIYQIMIRSPKGINNLKFCKY